MKAAHALLQLALVGGMALAVPPAEAQGWESTGLSMGINGPYIVYANTIHDWLLAGVKYYLKFTLFFAIV